MAFELEATAALAQALFFKFRSSEVTLRHASGRVTIDGDVLMAVRSAIAEKISAYTRNYIADLPLGQTFSTLLRCSARDPETAALGHFRLCRPGSGVAGQPQ